MSPTEIATNPTVRRLLMALLAGGAVALNKKLGLDLSAEQLYSLVGLASIYIFGSNYKESQLAHAEAAKTNALANTTDEEAKAAIQAAVDAELARRAALVVPPPAVTPVAR